MNFGWIVQKKWLSREREKAKTARNSRRTQLDHSVASIGVPQLIQLQSHPTTHPRLEADTDHPRLRDTGCDFGPSSTSYIDSLLARTQVTYTKLIRRTRETSKNNKDTQRTQKDRETVHTQIHVFPCVLILNWHVSYLKRTNISVKH